jgi:hypothetical protein
MYEVSAGSTHGTDKKCVKMSFGKPDWNRPLGIRIIKVILSKYGERLGLDTG